MREKIRKGSAGGNNLGRKEVRIKSNRSGKMLKVIRGIPLL